MSYAKSHDVIVQVLSTFGESIGSDLKGTFILNEKKATYKNFLSAFVMNEQVMGYEFQISKDQLESLNQMIRLHESAIKLSVCEKRSGEHGYKIYFSMGIKKIFEPFFQANNIPYKAINSLVECIFIGSNLFEHKAGLEKLSSLLLKTQLNQSAILYADSKISVIVSNDNKARLIDVVCSELMT